MDDPHWEDVIGERTAVNSASWRCIRNRARRNLTHVTSTPFGREAPRHAWASHVPDHVDHLGERHFAADPARLHFDPLPVGTECNERYMPIGEEQALNPGGNTRVGQCGHDHIDTHRNESAVDPSHSALGHDLHIHLRRDGALDDAGEEPRQIGQEDPNRSRINRALSHGTSKWHHDETPKETERLHYDPIEGLVRRTQSLGRTRSLFGGYEKPQDEASPR